MELLILLAALVGLTYFLYRLGVFAVTCVLGHAILQAKRNEKTRREVGFTSPRRDR